jgi:hypothetical protein
LKKDEKKAQKSAQKKKKKNAEKEKEKKKEKMEEDLRRKTDTNKMISSDFLINKTQTSQSVIDEFEFSDYHTDSDDPDVFEDSKEIQSDDEFLTPINFTSVFGKKTAALSTSTPNLSMKNASKRGASSPQDSTQPKKLRSKSFLPVKKPNKK